MKTHNSLNKFKAYEREKRQLRALELPPEQYEAAVKKLARRLRI